MNVEDKLEALLVCRPLLSELPSINSFYCYRCEAIRPLPLMYKGNIEGGVGECNECAEREFKIMNFLFDCMSKARNP